MIVQHSLLCLITFVVFTRKQTFPAMPIDKVWSRFEKKKKDGTILKLRIQDLPQDLSEKVTDLVLRYYAAEEPCQKAAGIAECPVTPKIYADYLNESFPDPDFSCVICCSDDNDEVTYVMGISTMLLTKEYTWGLEKEENKPKTKKWEKYIDICTELWLQYNPMEQHNLSTFYDDRFLLVVPEFRGLGIAREFLKSRRLICAAHGVPMTGAWMSSIGTQIAAARDGWDTVSEIRYEDLAEKCGVVFNGVPTTMKYMIARASSEDN